MRMRSTRSKIVARLLRLTSSPEAEAADAVGEHLARQPTLFEADCLAPGACSVQRQRAPFRSKQLLREHQQRNREEQRRTDNEPDSWPPHGRQAQRGVLNRNLVGDDGCDVADAVGKDDERELRLYLADEPDAARSVRVPSHETQRQAGHPIQVERPDSAFPGEAEPPVIEDRQRDKQCPDARQGRNVALTHGLRMPGLNMRAGKLRQHRGDGQRRRDADAQRFGFPRPPELSDLAIARADAWIVSRCDNPGVDEFSGSFARTSGDDALGDDKEGKRDQKLRVCRIVGEEIRGLYPGAVQTLRPRQNGHRHPCETNQKRRAVRKIPRPTAVPPQTVEDAIDQIAVEEGEGRPLGRSELRRTLTGYSIHGSVR